MRKQLGIWVDQEVIDHIDFEPYGVIRVCGWGPHADLPSCALATVDGQLQPMAVYRYFRPDVTATGVAEPFAGFSIEFRVRSGAAQRLVFGNHIVPIEPEISALVGAEEPGYSALLDDKTVWHRAQIYGEGPPTNFVHPEILKLALQLKPPILDFGCGNGAIIRELRRAGMEAYGIELERPPIRKSIEQDVAAFITLYDGQFPLPFADGRFESVFASEVIEHVPDYEAALAEISRVCRGRFAITVPDMSCIPIGSRLNYVPWHLLEGTHVNFFNHRSLRATLAPHFRSVRLFQIGRGSLEGQFMPGALGAIATK